MNTPEDLIRPLHRSVAMPPLGQASAPTRSSTAAPIGRQDQLSAHPPCP